MTKEVDFLSLTKSENSTTKTNTNSTKKEGLSLFDSFLVNNESEVDTNTQKNLEKSADNSNNTNLEQEVSKETQKVKTTEKKEITTSSNVGEKDNLQNIETKNIETKDLNLKEENTKEVSKNQVVQQEKSITTNKEETISNKVEIK